MLILSVDEARLLALELANHARAASSAAPAVPGLTTNDAETEPGLGRVSGNGHQDRALPVRPGNQEDQCR